MLLDVDCLTGSSYCNFRLNPFSLSCFSLKTVKSSVAPFGDSFSGAKKHGLRHHFFGQMLRFRFQMVMSCHDVIRDLWWSMLSPLYSAWILSVMYLPTSRFNVEGTLNWAYLWLCPFMPFQFSTPCMYFGWSGPELHACWKILTEK